MVLSVFGDESSDGKRERVFVVAGILGTDAEWVVTEQAWLARTGGEVFHAAECEHAKNHDLYRNLTQVLAHGQVAGISFALDLVSFREVFPDHLPDVGYYQCFSKVIAACARMGQRWNDRVAADPASGDSMVELKFTFDSRLESEQNAGRFYSTFINEPEWRDSTLLNREISFESRKNPRIQMADLFAREAMKDLDRIVGPNKFLERRSKIALQESERFRFNVLGRKYCVALKATIDDLKPESGYFRWLKDTGRVQKGRPHDNWDNRLRYLASDDSVGRPRIAQSLPSGTSPSDIPQKPPNLAAQQPTRHPIPSIDGVVAKIGRADRHYAVAARLVRWFARNKCSVDRVENSATGQIDVIARLAQPPEIISLVLGDASHNTRSALDHLVYQLVLSNPERPNTVPNKDTMFPICDTAEGYRKQIERGRLRGVTEEAAKLIDSFQPYHFREQGEDFTKHPLWVLDKLENIDKHRRLALVSGLGIGSRIQICEPSGNIIELRRGGPDDPIRDGDLLHTFKPPQAGEGEMHVKGQLVSTVSFNEPEAGLVTGDAAGIVGQILAYVSHKVLQQLAAHVR